MQTTPVGVGDNSESPLLGGEAYSLLWVDGWVKVSKWQSFSDVDGHNVGRRLGLACADAYLLGGYDGHAPIVEFGWVNERSVVRNGEEVVSIPLVVVNYILWSSDAVGDCCVGVKITL